MAGRLRTRGTIQKQTDAASGNTGTATTWVTYAAGVWAEIKPIRGREYFDSDKTQGEETHIIKFRFLRGLQQSMRFVPDDDNRIFRFVSIQNVDERDREIRVRATEDTD